MDLKIIKCKCQSEFQDKEYGKQMRIHNPCGKSNSREFGIKQRCTVCGDTKNK